MKSLTSWTCTTIRVTLLSSMVILSACQPITRSQRPQLIYTPSDEDINKFIPLKGIEGLNSDWEREYKIGVSFARERDYYRGITALKRALFLTPAHSQIKNNIYYNISLCYYFGKKYELATENLEKIQATEKWNYYLDYLTVLHDCYLKLGLDERADVISNKINKNNPSLSDKISIHAPLTKGDLKTLQASSDRSIQAWANEIKKNEKSPKAASILNAVLPGSGYLYLNQKSTALTAFIVNSLFIAATYRLVERHHVALSIITGSLELGWYIGGIHGAYQSASTYNRLHYEREASYLMKKKDLFPALMLNYAF